MCPVQGHLSSGRGVAIKRIIMDIVVVQDIAIRNKKKHLVNIVEHLI